MYTVKMSDPNAPGPVFDVYRAQAILDEQEKMMKGRNLKDGQVAKLPYSLYAKPAPTEPEERQEVGKVIVI